jgi:alpha-tubulin suppressor-like RCC1 family protein
VLYSWGCGAFGQLGHGDRLDRLVPTVVSEPPWESAAFAAAGYGATAVVDGRRCVRPASVAVDDAMVSIGQCRPVCLSCCFMCAFAASGALFTFGGGQDGVLGHGDCDDMLRPRQVMALATNRVTAIAVGDAHMLAITGQ